MVNTSSPILKNETDECKTGASALWRSRKHVIPISKNETDECKTGASTICIMFWYDAAAGESSKCAAALAVIERCNFLKPTSLGLLSTFILI